MDDTQAVLNTFQEYATTFEDLNPFAVLRFYHYPAILISREKAAAIKNRLEALLTLTLVMHDLKQRGYDHGKTPSLSVRQVADNLAIVSGTVIRYKKDRHEKDDTVLEQLGLTYTFRKVNKDWKIIAGILHNNITS
ncbi:MAG: hypothetical protein Kow00121_49710 [Elainellaceae cyanobacterium]